MATVRVAMMRILLIFIFVLLKLLLDCAGATLHSFVYHKDMSEHCRRRVIPSVFLGQHVTDANSQMLLFSRQDLPYNCFINVRTEVGNHIIVVIQLVSEESLFTSCSPNSDQMLIFEMGETFGGYWGPLPDSLMKAAPKGGRPQEQYYTIKTTTKSVVIAKTKISETQEEIIQETVPSVEIKSEIRPTTEEDMLKMEVPLVNVSGLMEPSDGLVPHKFLEDDTFDLVFDVTPRPNGSYETTVIPLVQFSVAREVGYNNGGEPRYQLDYDIDDRFTMKDMSPASPHKQPEAYSRTPYGKARTQFMIRRLSKHKFNNRVTPINQRSYFTNNRRRSKFNRHGTYRRKNEYKHRMISKDNVENISGKKFIYVSEKPSVAPTRTPDSWQHVLELMKKINKSLIKTKDQSDSNITMGNVSNLMYKISEMKKPNFSIYLAPDLDSYVSNKVIFTKGISNKITAKLNPFTARYSTSSFPRFSETQESFVKYTTAPLSAITAKNKPSMNVLKSTVTANNSTDTLFNTITVEDYKRSTKLWTKYILDKAQANYTAYYLKFTDHNLSTSNHLWTTKIKMDSNISSELESSNTNIDLKESLQDSSTLSPLTGSLVDHESWENLVQAAPEMALILNKSSDEVNNSSSNHKIRKRLIEVIPIKNAIPHVMSTKKVVATSSYYDFNKSAELFKQLLIEPQEDEIQGRVHLRYLRKYVGPAVFNICDFREAKARQVLLFNTSRILIAINNFTMKRMALVMTTARTLEGPNSRCPSSHLECQVSRSRVCIDSDNACDGVPNCGAYDIYDEDRLYCGDVDARQHSVYIAALTLLAVLMTLLYSIHYWLKRCVTKVSEAFFVYTDGTENILYLDSIMRSPTDADDVSKLVYNGNFFEDDVYLQERDNRTAIRKFIDKCPLTRIFRKKCVEVNLKDVGDQETPIGPRRIYSFTELEIEKMTAEKLIDKCIQTGESLEIQPISKNHQNKTIVSQEKGTRFDENVQESDSKISVCDLMLLMEPERSLENSNELNMIKLLRNIGSNASNTSPDTSHTKTHNTMINSVAEETELQSTVYDVRNPDIKKIPEASSIKPSSSAEVHTIRSAGSASNIRKRLRFEEKSTTIPSENLEMDEQPKLLSSSKSRRGATDILDTIDEEQSSSGMDFKRFWGTNKNKKTKNKTNVALRRN